MRLRRVLRFGLRTVVGRGTAVTVSLTDAEGRVHLDGPTWIRVVDRLRALGYSHFLFGGGDPLAHPDLDAILEHARRKGPVLLVIPPGADRLRLQRLPEVDTLAVAVVPGPEGLDRVTATLDAARALGRRWTLEGLVVASPDTAPWLREAAEAVVAHGAVVFLSPDDPRGWGAPVPRAIGRGDALGEVLQGMQRDRRALRLMVSDTFLADLRLWWDGRYRPDCHAGEGYIAVDAHGRLRACRGTRSGDRVLDIPAHAFRGHARAGRPAACACLYDDYHDHALTRKAPGRAALRAVWRTLRSFRSGA